MFAKLITAKPVPTLIAALKPPSSSAQRGAGGGRALFFIKRKKEKRDKKKVTKMSSFCFIELQQMSNKLEKLDLFKLPSIVFVQCTEIWGRFQNAAGPRNPAAGSCTRSRTHAPALPPLLPPHTRPYRHPAQRKISRT